MEYLICMTFFALAYAIKGGSGNILENWNKVRNSNKILERLMDGKVLSTIMVFVFAVIAFEGSEYYAVALPLAWLVAVAPSMGEEHGAIGDYKGALPGYLRQDQTHRGREYDVKKGLQRGVWMGAAMTLATGFVPFIWVSLLFVPVVFLGQCIDRLVMENPGWKITEFFIGAIIYGLPMALFLGGH